MPRCSPFFHLLAGLCLALGTTAQARMPLPHGTGSLAVLPGWTALAGPDLKAAADAGTPPSTAAPVDETGLALLHQTLATLRKEQRLDEHSLLHAGGTPGSPLRLVDGFSAEGSVRSSDLQTPAAIETIRAALQTHLTSPGVTVQFLGHETPKLFATGSIALAFSLTSTLGTLRLVQHVVPAGERIQYFETTCFDTDVDAAGEFDAVLRTFDGAKEPADGTLRNMLLGGALGGFLGMLGARWRQRRRMLAAAAGSETVGR